MIHHSADWRELSVNAACWKVSLLITPQTSSSTSWRESRLINIKCEHDSPSLVQMSVFGETADIISCRLEWESEAGGSQLCVPPAINVVMVLTDSRFMSVFRLLHRQSGESDEGVAVKMCPHCQKCVKDIRLEDVVSGTRVTSSLVVQTPVSQFASISDSCQV